MVTDIRESRRRLLTRRRTRMLQCNDQLRAIQSEEDEEEDEEEEVWIILVFPGGTVMESIEDGVIEVLLSVMEEVDQAASRNIRGAQLLHELLSAPWLRALLKVYECLLHFQRLKPNNLLPHASGLSHEIMAVMVKLHSPSDEARELYSLISSPHLQALLSSHDSVAQYDYGPILPPLPDDVPEDEEAMRIVCLVKNQQPLNGDKRRGSVGAGVELIRSRWNNLRRLTLERLVPGRRAWSEVELRTNECTARLLPNHSGGQPRPFLPSYESAGSCRLCPQTAALWKKGLNQSAASVCSPAQHTGSFSRRPEHNGRGFASVGGNDDDYAHPPPPVPTYSLSLPNSPILYQRGTTGGHSRNIPTPGRTPSCPGLNTAPSSPATRRSTQQQCVSALPVPGRHHGCRLMAHVCQYGCQKRSMPNRTDTTPCHNGRLYQIKQMSDNKQQQPKHNQRPQHPFVELSEQRSAEELRSNGQTVASSMEHSTQDVHHLGQKVVAATEMITGNVEENAQALNLLSEVVDKLQGLILANRHPASSPPCRLKKCTTPAPPARVSSVSPKVVRKPPTPYSFQLSSSCSSYSSSCSSSSSSSTSVDGFAISANLGKMNGQSKAKAVACSATHRPGKGSSDGQVRLNNGAVSAVPLEDQKECNTTGCLTTKKKKKMKT